VIGTSYLQAVKARMHRQTARPKPDRTEIKFDEATARVLERAQSFSNYLGSFDAITSIFSIEGDFVRSSDAFSFKACATLPFRCASRPESSANVSKIPYVDGPIYFRFLARLRLQNYPQCLSVHDLIFLSIFPSHSAANLSTNKQGFFEFSSKNLAMPVESFFSFGITMRLTPRSVRCLPSSDSFQTT